MAEQSTLANNLLERQHHEQATAEQESEPDDQIPSQLGYYGDAIGAFKDDPMLDAMMANIRKRRLEINADDNIR